VKHTSTKHFDLAIIGGGFSGVAVAFNIQKELQRLKLSLSCVLFEPYELIGAGAAYSTQDAAHLLNVVASKMSIDEKDPESFVRWLNKNSFSYTANDFVPRYIYQKYISEMFNTCSQNPESCLRIQIVRSPVASINEVMTGRYNLHSEDRVNFTANKVVIAVGNSPVSNLKPISRNLVENPWNLDVLQSGAKVDEIAIIGTGLSAVDTVLSLEQLSFKGKYTLISRRGLLPQPHPLESHTSLKMEVRIDRIKKAGSLRTMLREFRILISEGVLWHNLIDALRPSSQDIWKQLSLDDKQRFIRHLRSLWASHRHRVPKESENIISQLVKKGRLKVIRSNFHSAELRKNKIWLTVSKEKSRDIGPYDKVYNCMGIWADLRRSQSPLIESLLKAHLASYDDLFFGLRTGTKGQLLRADGRIVRGLYTLGSLRRGELWETTAVREIRSQAQEIARLIVINIGLSSNFTQSVQELPSIAVNQ
jgi:uncharacterized NAD(P)/FAD-binding protein YdhS